MPASGEMVPQPEPFALSLFSLPKQGRGEERRNEAIDRRKRRES
jgi:hypothetical protein